MKWARGHYDSIYGRFNSEWKINKVGWEYKATVPPNTSAVLVLPVTDVNTITENGKTLEVAPGITMLPLDNGNIALEVGSSL